MRFIPSVPQHLRYEFEGAESHGTTPKLLFPVLNVSIFFTLVLLFSGIVEHIICHGTHMTPTTQSHLLFLLMCDMGHLLAKACEKCLCEVVLSWVRWHRAHASPTCCCRRRRVEGSFAESSCWQAKGQDLSNNPARVPRVPSCCPRLTNATQRLIHVLYVTRLLHRCGSGSCAGVTGAGQSSPRGEKIYNGPSFALEIAFKTLCVVSVCVRVSKNKTLARAICSRRDAVL